MGFTPQGRGLQLHREFVRTGSDAVEGAQAEPRLHLRPQGHPGVIGAVRTAR
jgi:hypothetical protein